MSVHTRPNDPDPVWVAIRRAGVTAHRPVWAGTAGPPEHRQPAYQGTACGRSMRTGDVITAGEHRYGLSLRWCADCWPKPQETAA